MMPEEQDVMKRRSEDALKVTVIGTGDGSRLETGDIGRTPGAAPNLVTIVVNPFVAILVRFVHSYLTAVVGLLIAVPSAGAVLDQQVVPFSDFADLLTKSLTLALAGPIVAAIKDIATIFARLETKYPLWSGSV